MQINQAIKESGRSKFKIALDAKISPGDFYLALNGKKPFYPGWRKRIADVLQLPEDELFPEYRKDT